MMISMVRSNDKDDCEDEEMDGADGDICIVMKCVFLCVSQKMSTFPLMS